MSSRSEPARRRQPLGLAAAGVLAALAAGGAAAQDDFEGLPPGPGQEDVYYACNACHSLAIVKQQRLPRERWAYLMDWMVDEQGMEPMEPDELTRVVDYLAQHYGIGG